MCQSRNAGVLPISFVAWSSTMLFLKIYGPRYLLAMWDGHP